MRSQTRRVSLRRFIQVGEMLDLAFPDPMPTPDYLAHECQEAEQALLKAQAAPCSTADPQLARLFALGSPQKR
jgi:hypothetical protein